MSRMMLALALGMVMGGGAAAAQEGYTPVPPITRPPPAPPAPPEIVLARWARPPTPVFPELAMAEGVEGEAQVLCTAAVSGLLVDCELVGESPPGLGFGEQALAAVAMARVHPRTVGGEPVDSRAIFTVMFRFPPEESD